MKKLPLSLLEVMIGLALTAILLTTLFSCFRELMQARSHLAKIRQEKHWEYVLNVRLGQIFEAVHAGDVFVTEPPKTLHFAFDNGLDADPKFCNELEGFLSVNKEKEFCLVIQSKGGEERKEVFAKNCANCSIHFFDPISKKWKEEWNLNYLPPIVKIAVSDKVFQFVLPHGARMVTYP